MRKLIRKTINELQAKIGIDGKVTFRLKPMKKKVASVSLTKMEIRINKNLLSKMDEMELRKVIAHELLHIKHGIYHTKKFEEELRKILRGD